MNDIPSDFDKARALHLSGRSSEARPIYEAILKIRPHHADALHMLGMTHFEEGRFDVAEGLVAQAVELDSRNAAYLNNYSLILIKLGRQGEAFEAIANSLELDPDDANTYYNLALNIQGFGLIQESIPVLEAALAYNPDNHLIHNNLAYALQRVGELKSADWHFRQALRLRPEFASARFNRALLDIACGEFERGWLEYEWRWQLPTQALERRNFPRPSWDGRPLNGKTILLHAEQGIGDTIQFARYVPMVKERVGRVIMLVDQSRTGLAELFQSLAGVDEIYTNAADLPNFAFHCPLGSLPLLFETRVDTIPAKFPYLAAGVNAKRQWQERLAPFKGLKVGLVWAGRAMHRNDRFRSLYQPKDQIGTTKAVPDFNKMMARVASLPNLGGLADSPRTPAADNASLEVLFDIEGIDWFSLQVGERQSDLPKPLFTTLTDLSAHLTNFEQTAAALEELDLLITVDTSVVHVAGALGRPALLLKSKAPEWRWPSGQETSPWYPSVEVFEQKRLGDWTDAIDRAAGQLREMVSL
ncbi:tetratricopeptide repeat protein [Nisaea sp.]|uniref:tetratricopeptide repeat protein n=1 Tax=Nisaea sp. TaxID=2024842 RepID=UPI003296C0CB